VPGEQEVSEAVPGENLVAPAHRDRGDVVHRVQQTDGAIGKAGPKATVVVGLLVQAVATLPLIFLGTGSRWIILLLIVTFIGGVANLVAIVGFMVTATSGLPDDKQGLATGLATMSQQVGITMGIPVMSAIASGRIHTLGAQTPRTVLSGVSTAITANVALCLVTALVLGLFLRTRPAGKQVTA
jgi:MFS family permease